MKKINAEILADSISEQGHRITTMLLTFPRFILPELLTHRMFSRNSASSRAIPFEKMVKMVEEDPFTPVVWQKDHKGMQGIEYFSRPLSIEPDKYWLETRDRAVLEAKRLNEYNITKQICNRLLEPFMWHQTIVTATEWSNFFELRCPKYQLEKRLYKSKKDFCKNERGLVIPKSNIEWLKMNTSQVEIHMQALAESMWDAMNESTPKPLKSGEWHIPYGDKIYDPERFTFKPEFGNCGSNELKIKIAVARIARLSYANHDGDIDYAKDIELHDRLLRDKHFSPMEHIAKAMSVNEYYNMYEKTIPQKNNRNFIDYQSGWCDNFRGWISYRHLVQNNAL